MAELVVILGALVILALSIAGMNIHRRWNDVLTGPYISNAGYRSTIPDRRQAELARRQKRRKVRSFGRGPSSDPTMSRMLKKRIFRVGGQSRPIT